MSLGTLYANERTRPYIPKILIKHLDLDVKIEEPGADYTKMFPLGKVPTFVGPKGFKLQEVLAISVYLIKQSEKGAKFLGKDDKEFAQVLKWCSLTNSEFIPTSLSAFGPLIGRLPYNKKQVDDALVNLDKIANMFEARLSEFTYLVGERVTLADLAGFVSFYRPFQYLLGADWRKRYPAITRWFTTLINSPIVGGVVPKLEFREKMLEYVPPKKEKKKQQQPQPQAPKKVEEAPASGEVKKPKHPLEALGKSKTSLDEWKRIYSNEETRETAIPWFWKNMYDPSEWSLWKVDYKYNDELTLTFMSNNLVGGFFNRLSASTKFMFGCMVVYGENNNNGITGFFMVRGQDFAPAFDVAPDWESYSYTKIDGESDENKKFINNMLAWDEPVTVNGESKEIADGKVFK